MKFAIWTLETQAESLKTHIKACERDLSHWEKERDNEDSKRSDGYIEQRIMDELHLMANSMDKLRDIEMMLKAVKANKMIGKRVYKKSGKPFKSGRKVNTVIGVVNNPHSPDRLAYIFFEDDTCVNTGMCKELV